jgi:hypothetical protein
LRSTVAADLDAVGISNNREGGKAAIYPDEPPISGLPLLMAQATMIVGSLEVQAHIPSVSSPPDRRGQDSGARSYDGLTGVWVDVLGGTEHPAQPPGVVIYPDGPDPREPNRSRMTFSDTYSVATARIPLVAETKAVMTASFALTSRKADLAVATLSVSRKPSTKIYGSFLEHLSRDLVSPGEPGYLLDGGPVGRNHEHAAGVLTGLPAVERVDQVKA